MNSTAAPISSYFPFLTLAVAAVLAVANYIVAPGHGRTIAIALVAIHVLGLIAVFCLRQPAATRSIRNGVFFAGLMMALALALKIGHSFGNTDRDYEMRLLMVLLGVFLVSLGNEIPKRLRPLPPIDDEDGTLSYHAARAEAVGRFVGWTQVLAAIGFSVCWIVLPSDLALACSMVCIFGGVALSAYRAAAAR